MFVHVYCACLYVCIMSVYMCVLCLSVRVYCVCLYVCIVSVCTCILCLYMCIVSVCMCVLCLSVRVYCVCLYVCIVSVCLYIYCILSMADLEVFWGFRPIPPLRFRKPSEILVVFKGSATPLFRYKSFKCIRLGVLLRAKFNLVCFNLLTTAGCNLSSTYSKLNFCKARNVLLKVLDPSLCSFCERIFVRHL